MRSGGIRFVVLSSAIAVLSWFVLGTVAQADGIQPGKTLTEFWNGSSWKLVASPNVGSQDELTGVAALSLSNVWAVGTHHQPGTGPVVLHWNGSKWSAVTALGAPAESELNGIAAISANDIWSVGTFNGEQKTLTQHWNGSKWSTIFSPNSVLPINQLNGVAAISAHDVWAVGFATANDGTPHTLAMHWNGDGWKIFPTPNPSPGSRLFSVDGATSNDVWAVGGAGFNGPPHAIIEHWNGAKWSLVSSPKEDGLSGVAAKTSSNVFAVGKSGGASGGANQTLVEHWNGSGWKVMSTPNVGPGDNELQAVAVGGDGPLAVGDRFNPGSPTLATLVLRFNGSAWKVQSSPNSADKFNELTAVSEVPGTAHAWAVGFSSNVAGG